MKDKQTLDILVKKLVEEVALEVKQQADRQLAADIAAHLGRIDFNATYKEAVRSILAEKLQEFEFPENSIAGTAIRNQELQISGDQVTGGIITNFGSTGIDDRATKCIVTILDDDTVVENNLTTQDLTVKGSMIIDGNFVVNGEIAEGEFLQSIVAGVETNVRNNLDQDLFSSYSDIIFKQIQETGIDLNRITLDNEVFVSGNSLGIKITESNLQKVGYLRELQVQGEALIYDSFYVGNKRVGINTLEPSAALSIWDEEVELTLGKNKKNIAVIQTPRAQTLILGSNSKDNIILNTDGSTDVKQLNLGTMSFSSSDTVPNYSSTKGTVVFNANPSLGGPLGWICLGGPSWANFGIID
jgi:hypothetical protein